MTGGLAWIYDADGSFVRDRRFHPEFVEPQPFAEVEPAAQQALCALIEQHQAESSSGLAAGLLAGWPASAAGFIRLTPLPQV